MIVMNNEIGICFDDLNENAKQKFLKAMELKMSYERNYDKFPIAYAEIPEEDNERFGLINAHLERALLDLGDIFNIHIENNKEFFEEAAIAEWASRETRFNLESFE